MRQYSIFILIFVMFSLSFGNAKANEYSISGYVIDSITQKPIPFATIFNEQESKGIITDSTGVFYLTLTQQKTVAKISSTGYNTREVLLPTANTDSLVISLIPEGVILQELLVKKQREKYSKRNNPAVDFVNRIRSNNELTSPHVINDFYNYDKYEKITLGLNNFTDKPENSWMFEKFQFLNNYIDTSEISGKPILNVSVKEKASQILYRKEPQGNKEIIYGIKRTGIDDITEQESLQTLIEDIFREIDLYQNDINILQYRFVSPLSSIAPDFYKFYLTDTVFVDDEECIQLSFAPHNSHTFGFVGHIYVPTNDTTMFIKKVNMKISPSINLNFIEQMYVNQEFMKSSNGSRLKIKDDITMEISVISGAQGLYARKNTIYTNHNFINTNQDIFNDNRDVIVAENAYSKDDTFWTQIRTAPISKNEDNLGSMLTQLRNVPIYYWTEKAIRLLVSGYVHTSKESKFDFGPINTFISHNDFEGWRFRVGGLTTANLNKHLFARGFVAYGIKDQKFKYSGELEYSFNPKKYHSQEFPIHSLRLTHLYDVDQLGQQYTFTNKDNFFLSLKRHEDNLMTYHRLTDIKYSLELYNNFSLYTSIANERQEATLYVPFINGYGKQFSYYSQNYIKLKLRYAPGEKFYQTKSERLPINIDAPIFELTQTYSPKGFMGSMFEINKTELSAQKRFWFSAFGYCDVILKGGHVWSKSPYPNLLLPNANLSYTIQPESFALMNPLEFINDSYASWDITYWANGAIFNYIPLINKLKLREVFSFRGFWGHLSNKNNPTINQELFQLPSATQHISSTPYMEVGVGLDNIFKIFRFDYVWRLTYRNNPNINKSGLRVALHLTF